MKLKYSLLAIVPITLLIIVAASQLINDDKEGIVSGEANEADTNQGIEEHSQEELDFIAENRSPDVPPLPFDDNPDPTQCGIPVQWGNSNNVAYLVGIWEGELIQPEVLLYDSHSRLEVVASAPHGTQVEIVLYQNNPVLNYYLVRIPDAEAGQNQGWVPAPFLSFEPVS